MVTGPANQARVRAEMPKHDVLSHLRGPCALVKCLCAGALLSLAAACAPGLPKEATKSVSDSVSALSDGFAGLEKAYVASTLDIWKVEAVASGRRIGMTDGCTTATGVKSEVVVEIGEAAKRAQTGSAEAISDDWERIAKKLSDALADCAIQSHSNARRPVPVQMFPTDVIDDDHRPEVDVEFNREFRTRMKSLSAYYKALARAAAAEDIEKEAAALKALSDAVSSTAGKVVSLLVIPLDLGPFFKAGGDLLVAVRTASLEAERYDAIEQALKGVPNDTLDDVEDALGLSALFLQATITNAILDGRAQQQITVFNAWDPRDVLGSTVRLEAAITAVEDARRAGAGDVASGIAKLAEMHADLTAEVAKREGTFSATFERIVTIAEAAAALDEAARKLIQKEN